MTAYHNGKCIQHRDTRGRFHTVTLNDLGMVACPECGQLYAYEARPLVCDGGIWHRITNPDPAKCPNCGTVAEVRNG